MTSPIALLRQRSRDSWLIGLDCHSLTKRAEDQLQTLMQEGDRKPPTVLLAEPDPADFVAGFIAACAAQCPIFLGNPHWVEAEWQQVFEQIQPDVILGEVKEFQGVRSKKGKLPEPGWIMIPTGGSSGQVRFAVHTWQTLTASVMGFQQHFESDTINSCCTLPLYHVSGLMQMLRSLLTGGKLAIVPFKQLDFKQPPEFDPTDFFISLVPTQLQRLLQDPEAIAWLSQFRTVLLGGAPAWDDLLAAARRHQIQLAPTYGMTETASQVATLKPVDFLAGKTGSGRALPHAKIQIVDPQNQPMERGQVGAIAIQSASLALGYYGNWGALPQTTFQTDDVGYLDAEGYLHIVGRASRKIITGGENVFPDEVEAAIRATGLVADVCVVGLPDRQWGEGVTAVYVPCHPEVEVAQIQGAIASRLSRFKQPKRWVIVEALPRNAQGKISYESVKTLGD
ncbi:MAG: 2-succinylbenzoate--CoA ligase [Drouetiella hepatica Uher 2000/2452]|jgi:O-succinylbenzoic acid--CoA ligase|uniref:2-succinylbenzoate--CoA ligase n=1 Tax=Drouetiella hepatica Uher 2000/2452 TaxID=904376 RepID=A0A951UKS3_9CYAN|nr:2-succinylbenzoate--CoA ligase [Drouetiella hepatica Uher 2000/2452]